VFRYDVDGVVSEMAEKGLKGAIIPDLPPEEGKDYFHAMEKNGLAPILIFSPTTPDERMTYLDTFAKGFVYCVARKGVTGQDTRFSDELAAYMDRCRRATSLPLAVGFGVKDKADIDFLKSKADIAVVGTQTIRIMDEKGVQGVEDFIQGLR
jgi:tryptophan synthase alpha chain